MITGFKNTDIIKDQLSKCSLRRKKSLLNLPPKNIISEIVEMDSDQSRFYNEVKNGVKEEVDKVELKTSSLLALVGRLRQATACPSILTTSNISSAKIDRACQLVEEIVSNGEKVVIFSTYKETVNELDKKLSKYNPLIGTGDLKDSEVSQNVDDFQNNVENKVFIATWQKCGTGLTLTAASYMIFIDTPWTAGVFEQACDRIYRIGTKNPVFIYKLITKDTIDERVDSLLQVKKAISDYMIDNDTSQEVLDALKNYLKELQ